MNPKMRRRRRRITMESKVARVLSDFASRSFPANRTKKEYDGRNTKEGLC